MYLTFVNLSSRLAYGGCNTVTFRNDTDSRSRYPHTGYGVNSHSPGVHTNTEWLSYMLTGCGTAVFQMTSDFTLLLSAVWRHQFHTVQLTVSLFLAGHPSLCVLGRHTTSGLSILSHWYARQCKSQVLNPGDESPPSLYFYFLQPCGYVRSLRVPCEFQDCSQEWQLGLTPYCVHHVLIYPQKRLSIYLGCIEFLLTLIFSRILFIHCVCTHTHLCVFEGIKAMQCMWTVQRTTCRSPPSF